MRSFLTCSTLGRLAGSSSATSGISDRTDTLARAVWRIPLWLRRDAKFFDPQPIRPSDCGEAQNPRTEVRSVRTSAETLGDSTPFDRAPWLRRAGVTGEAPAAYLRSRAYASPSRACAECEQARSFAPHLKAKAEFAEQHIPSRGDEAEQEPIRGDVQGETHLGGSEKRAFRAAMMAGRLLRIIQMSRMSGACVTYLASITMQFVDPPMNDPAAMPSGLSTSRHGPGVAFRSSSSNSDSKRTMSVARGLAASGARAEGASTS